MTKEFFKPRPEKKNLVAKKIEAFLLSLGMRIEKLAFNLINMRLAYFTLSQFHLNFGMDTKCSLMSKEIRCFLQYSLIIYKSMQCMLCIY